MRALLAALALAPSLALAALPAPVLDSLQRAGVPPSAVAVVVAPAGGGRPALAHQADRPMNPASTMKLVTTAAALDLLGPAFRFHTDALATGTLADGVLAGDLVLRGGGDPGLTYERLWQLAHQLRARGLREIRGDVVLDRGYFAPAPFDPAGFDGEARRAYNVGPDALLVNFKAVDFRFVPGPDGVRVVPEPDFPNVAVASRLRASREACNHWRQGLRYEVDEKGLLATVSFSGEYPADCGEKSLPLSLFDADRYFESAFRWVWGEAGGRLAGKVRAGTTPPEARLLLRFDSEPLASLLRDMNKYSNNVMARQVYLALSAERSGGPGSLAASARVVSDWLASRGIAAPGLVLDNGAGLSRSGRITAGTLAAVLQSAWAGPAMAELVSSLSLFAVDGTFKLRPGGAAAGSAHLKGGTLNGVQAIAGFVLDANGRRWVVVMLANHDNANRAQGAMDALVEWVHAGAR